MKKILGAGAVIFYLSVGILLSPDPFARSAQAAERDFTSIAALNPKLERYSERVGHRFRIIHSRHARSLRVAEDACRDGKRGSCYLQDWQVFLRDIAANSEREQLELVNRYINGAPYVSDARNWDRLDHWAIPSELFARGGDCEDYVIAKYLSLRQLGVPAEKLRIVAVQDLRRGEDHAVLTVESGGKLMVLDNHYRRVRSWDDLRADYVPYYSLNEDGVWMHRARI
jgi:predicted transglutaminase-like cysteine proteinase